MTANVVASISSLNSHTIYKCKGLVNGFLILQIDERFLSNFKSISRARMYVYVYVRF